MASPIITATIQAGLLSALSNIIAQLLSCHQANLPYRLDPTPLTHFVLFSILACPPNYLWQTYLERRYPGYTTPSTPGTTTSIANHPTTKSLTDRTAPAVRAVNDRVSAATSALEDSDLIQRVKRSTTEGIESVKSKASQYGNLTGHVRRASASLTGGTFYSEASEKQQQAETAGGLYTTPDGTLVDRLQEGGPARKKLNLRNTAIKFALDQTLGAAVNTVLFVAGMALLKGEALETVVGNVREQFWPLLFAGQKLWPLVSIVSFTLVPVEKRTVFGGIVGVGWGIFLSLRAAAAGKGTMKEM